MSKSQSADKVLILTGSLVRDDVVSILIGNGFSVAHINYFYGMLLILALLKPDVVLVDEVLATDTNACYQIQKTFDAPVVLIAGNPHQGIWTRAISCPLWYQGKDYNSLIGEVVSARGRSEINTTRTEKIMPEAALKGGGAM